MLIIVKLQETSIIPFDLTFGVTNWQKNQKKLHS